MWCVYHENKYFVILYLSSLYLILVILLPGLIFNIGLIVNIGM